MTDPTRPVLGEEARRWLESAIGPYLVGGTVGQQVMTTPLVDEILRYLHPRIDEAIRAAERRGYADAIHKVLERNPAYQAARAEVEEAERQEPPREIDVKALFEELRAKRDDQ